MRNEILLSELKISVFGFPSFFIKALAKDVLDFFGIMIPYHQCNHVYRIIVTH